MHYFTMKSNFSPVLVSTSSENIIEVGWSIQENSTLNRGQRETSLSSHVALIYSVFSHQILSLSLCKAIVDMKLQNLKISYFDLASLSLDDLPVRRVYIKSEINDILFDLSSVTHNGFFSPCEADLINKICTHVRTDLNSILLILHAIWIRHFFNKVELDGIM